ncbi:MAG: PEP-CTERM sorting domain-containing protein [Cyanobacteria bacterium P01_H01_bin.35]
MKTKLSILLTAIAGGVISAMPAQAASFGTDGISFDEETTVEFGFTGSYGRYRTDLRVYEVVDGEIAADLGLLFGEIKAADDMVWNEAKERYEPTSDPVGTLGNAVKNYTTDDPAEAFAQFTFESGKEYTLGIVNYHFSQPNELAPKWASKGIKYSTSGLNEGGTQQAVFGSTGGSELNGFDASEYQNGDPFAGLLDISFDDGGNNNDMDFQDFTLTATTNPEFFGGGLLSESTPEPATLAGLGIVAGGMFLSRSRKKQK